MTRKCENCDRENDFKRLFCELCKQPLLSVPQMIRVLMERQASLEKKQRNELDTLNFDIIQFKRHYESQANKEQFNKPKTSIPEPIKDFVPDDLVKEAKTPIVENPQTVEDKQNIFIPVKEKELYEPSSFEIGIQNLLEPIHAGLGLVTKLYTKYKSEGKLPIFFMTVAGILAILFGFGYLMQYSLQYLGDYAQVAKISIGFFAAFGVGITGYRLYIKNENYQEFGSALISLGLILNYLMIYFLSDLGNFPVLSSSIFGFSLIIANTAIAIFLSLKFETKIVAVLFLIGGSLAPFYLNSTSDGTMYYLYLWFLILGANIVAESIKWKTLYYLSFLLAFGLLEVVVFNYDASAWSFVLYYHLFAYLFFYFTLFENGRLRLTLEKKDLVILSANLSFLVFNIYSAYTSEFVTMGILYLGNGIAFGLVLFRFWKSLESLNRLTITIIIGSFVGFAIPALVHHSLHGLFWSIEAVLLIVFGFIQRIRLVRNEGYLLFVLAIAKLVLGSIPLITLWEVNIWHEGLLNYLVLGAVVTGLWCLGYRYSKDHSSLEKVIYAWIKEFIPLWATSAFLLISFGLIGNYVFVLVPIPVYGLIYWKKHFKTINTDIFGFLCLLFPILSFIVSTDITESYHFSDQHLFAQISILELFLSLWFIQKYYEILNETEKPIFELAKIFRITFYVLVPLLFIHLVRRNAFEFIEAAFSIGALMSFFLFRYLKFVALRNETYILLFLGFVASILFADVIAVIVNMVVVLTILIMERADKEVRLSESPFKPLLIVAPYPLAISISYLVGLYTDSIGIPSAIFALMLLLLVYFKDNIAILKRTSTLSSKIAFVVNLLCFPIWAFEEQDSILFIQLINIALWAVLLVNNKNWYDKKESESRWTWSLVHHQIQIVLLYVFVQLALKIDLDGILLSIILVVHAIILLFLSFKNQIRSLNRLSIGLFGLALAKVVFNDIRGFDTSGKIIVLIVLGALLLGASYGYLKMKKHFEDQQELTNPSKENTEPDEKSEL